MPTGSPGRVAERARQSWTRCGSSAPTGRAAAPATAPISGSRLPRSTRVSTRRCTRGRRRGRRRTRGRRRRSLACLDEVRDVVQRVVEPEDVDAVLGRSRDEAPDEVAADRPRADEEAAAERERERSLIAPGGRGSASTGSDPAAHGRVEDAPARDLEVGGAGAVEDLRQRAASAVVIRPASGSCPSRRMVVSTNFALIAEPSAASPSPSSPERPPGLPRSPLARAYPCGLCRMPYCRLRSGAAPISFRNVRAGPAPKWTASVPAPSASRGGAPAQAAAPARAAPRAVAPASRRSARRRRARRSPSTSPRSRVPRRATRRPAAVRDRARSARWDRRPRPSRAARSAGRSPNAGRLEALHHLRVAEAEAELEARQARLRDDVPPSRSARGRRRRASSGGMPSTVRFSPNMPHGSSRPSSSRHGG